ncbi:MAG: OsmC family protein [Ferruginibacter sp.]|nr:OsmC family protein [Ferruginibacter sp.]
MTKIFSNIKNERYKVEIKSSTNNVVIADEPLDKGGRDIGFSPYELLASALAACTCITLKMYANHKGWNVDEVNIEIELEKDEKENKTIIHRKIILIGDLDEMQKARLLTVANSCPIHKILSNPIEIKTELK